ncbi:hypothetical protein IAE30_27070 [Pantoea sp. S61]|uniref:hypothetical protein n=1 Tax=Pantoea sp. S61 TaxID=2767442 RepID=UPI001909AFB9|nr:hypothetical protein [Pantoea sp. S61]MBK0127411.1 hypothetical protein [Pantoea sp. S61]
MSAAPQSAPVTEQLLTIRRLPAGIQPDAPVHLLVSARVELQGLNPSEPLSPLEEARQHEGMTRRLR